MWRNAIYSLLLLFQMFSSSRMFPQGHVSQRRDRGHIGVRMKTLAVFHRFGSFAIMVPNHLHLKRLVGTKQTAQNEKQHQEEILIF